MASLQLLADNGVIQSAEERFPEILRGRASDGIESTAGESRRTSMLPTPNSSR